MAGGATREQVRALAALLILVVPLNPALASLPGDPGDRHLPVLYRTGVHRTRHPVPASGVARVGVRRDAFHGRLRIEVAVQAIEPEVVANNRAAVGQTGVVRLDNAGCLLEIWSGRRRRQCGIEVVA